MPVDKGGDLHGHRRRRRHRAEIDAADYPRQRLRTGCRTSGSRDIKTSTEKARSLGATILRDVTTEVMDMGWLSILKDPKGP